MTRKTLTTLFLAALLAPAARADGWAEKMFADGTPHDFGPVSRGQAVAKSVDVEYAGPLNWQAAEVVVAKDQPLEAAATEWYRKPGGVGYHIKVALKADAPAGPLREFIYLKTNDAASP